jgi:hypothetical protein
LTPGTPVLTVVPAFRALISFSPVCIEAVNYSSANFRSARMVGSSVDPSKATASSSSSSGSSSIAWNYLAVVAVDATILMILIGLNAVRAGRGRDKVTQ